jgi:hypothetical protein
LKDLGREINREVTGMSTSLPEITVPKARDRLLAFATHLAGGRYYDVPFRPKR